MVTEDSGSRVHVSTNSMCFHKQSHLIAAQTRHVPSQTEDALILTPGLVSESWYLSDPLWACKSLLIIGHSIS